MNPDGSVQTPPAQYFPLPAVASDSEAGGRLCWNTESPPQAWAACIFNEVILAGGCRLQSLCRDWHLLALFSGGIWPPRRPLTTSSLDSGFSTNSPVLLRVGGGPVQPQKVPFRTFTALFPGQARATFQDRDCVRGLTNKDEPRVLRAPVYILFQ